MSSQDPRTKHLSLEELRRHLDSSTRAEPTQSGRSGTMFALSIKELQAKLRQRKARATVPESELAPRITLPIPGPPEPSLLNRVHTQTRLQIPGESIGRPLLGRPQESQAVTPRSSAPELEMDLVKTTIYQRPRPERPDRRTRWTRAALACGALALLLGLAMILFPDAKPQEDAVAQAPNPANAAAEPGRVARAVSTDTSRNPSLVSDAQPHTTDAGALAAGSSGEATLRVRQAVDFLLSGETRRALDAYRAIATKTPGPEWSLAVRLLERELVACSEQRGEECGF